MTGPDVATTLPPIGGPHAVTPELARSLCQVSTRSSRDHRRTPHPPASTKGRQR
jgi:hypothetical protein